jgi:hypothetical protein
MNIKVGDIWLARLKGSQHEGVHWTFQMIAESIDDNGNRAILGAKHMPHKRMFVVGQYCANWFDKNGHECDEGDFFLYTRSKAKPIPLLIEKEL